MAEGVVVFGDDGSTEADLAWSWISAQNWNGWTAQVISAHPPEIPTRLSSEGADKAHSWSPENPREAPKSAGLAGIDHLTAEVDPRIALTSATDASLIVVGPRGHGAMKALGIGSTAEYLLAGAPAPLVIARTNASVNRILLCCDGSDFSLHAAEAVASLPWAGSTEVAIITVNPALGHDAEGVGRAVETIAATGARVTQVTGDGKVSRAIEQEAEQNDADLIALGTRSIAGLRKAFLGSTASWIARHSVKSVLIAFPEPTE